MRKLRDPLSLGMVSGLVGGMVGYAVDTAVATVGKSPVTWTHQAAGVTVSANYRSGLGHRAVGAVSVMALSAMLGIPYAYLLATTGRSSLAGKSALYAVVSWMLLHGAGSRATGTFDSPPATSLAVLAGNLASAAVQAVVVSSLADSGFFRDDVARPSVPRGVRVDRSPYAGALAPDQAIHCPNH